ncbi:MAG: hypothetical protein K0R02_309 [Rickettsiaceae bacterium]|jgi:hypothetical protein|nr:hypothetical protein [Rickettsiaceae bacterium]
MTLNSTQPTFSHSSRDITSGILGANTTSEIFSNATDHDSFRLVYKDRVFSFKFNSQGEPNAARGEFDTLETLAEAINIVEGIDASIVTNRLHLESDNPITATDLTTTPFVTALGLVPVETDAAE